LERCHDDLCGGSPSALPSAEMTLGRSAEDRLSREFGTGDDRCVAATARVSALSAAGGDAPPCGRVGAGRREAALQMPSVAVSGKVPLL
jgi:hypothetical protein